MSIYEKLPSYFYPGDEGVKLCLPGQPELLHLKVTKVIFTESGKVLYDLEVNWIDEHRHTTRIHNVDSAFVLDMFWEPSMTDPKNTGKEEDFVIDQRYEKNSRGRWELKPEVKEFLEKFHKK